MSWTAHRFTGEVARREGNPRKITRHHCPPQNPDKRPRIIKVDERHHRAWHLLFGSPASKSHILTILKRDWGFDDFPD